MNTSILNLSTLFVILNTGFCSSCKDKNEPETVCTSANTVPVPQDMKDRFFFKEGTYWIYKNLATNKTDSLWVIANTMESINVDDDDYGFIKNKCYERFVSTIKSDFQATDSYHNVYAIIIHPKKGQPDSELFGLEDFNLPLDRLAYRIENRGGQYENQMGAEIELTDSLVTADNIVYKDILHLYYPTGTSTYDYLRDMYYAKNKGLVKFKRNTDNSEWELIRYNIIQ